ncbi:hypothetical protein Plec18167_001603 [Paecilomyces lecythidis]|uniref:Raptor N-terminal CASPase-like domain-containing protein n=1 Tax=Paecilomyces lecythidis TaxID=3004212 RepID=A0ABR3Y9G4_9EURO
MVLTKDIFEQTLRDAIKKREMPYYNKYAFHFRWADDDTGAERDFQSFKSMMDTCGFPNPDEWVIPLNSPIPEWEIVTKLAKIIGKVGDADGRSIIVIHYAGHGVPSSSSGELLFTNSRGKTIKAAAIIALLENSLPKDMPVDILLIFDCCGNFLARTLTPDSRLIEIITAGNKRDSIAFESTRNTSLTFELFMEVRSRARKSHLFVEVVDIVSEIRRTSPVKTPHHTSLLGIGSIRLPLGSNSAAMSNAIMGRIYPPLARYAATFSIHTSHTYDAKELEQLSSWIVNPEGDCKLTLEYVKETSSTLFIFEAPYTAFLRIQGLPGVTLLAEHEPSYPRVQQHIQPTPDHIVGTENM